MYHFRPQSKKNLHYFCYLLLGQTSNQNKMTTFVRDPCGIVCIILTYLSILYADYVIVKWVVIEAMHDR